MTEKEKLLNELAIEAQILIEKGLLHINNNHLKSNEQKLEGLNDVSQQQSKLIGVYTKLVTYLLKK